MKKILSTKGFLALAVVVLLLTPMLAFACVRTPSAPSVLNDIGAAFARFR